MGVRMIIRTQVIPSISLALFCATLSGCVNGNFVSETEPVKSSSSQSTNFTNPTGGTTSSPITAKRVATFEDPNGFLQRGAVYHINLEDKLRAFAVNTAGSVTSFLGNCLNDPSYATQTVSIKVMDEASPAFGIAVEIPYRNLRIGSSAAGSTPVLANGFIIGATGTIAMISSPSLPERDAVARLSGPNEVSIYGGFIDDVPSQYMTRFLIKNGGSGQFVDLNNFPYSPNPTEFHLVPANPNEISNSAFAAEMRELVKDMRFLNRPGDPTTSAGAAACGNPGTVSDPEGIDNLVAQLGVGTFVISKAGSTIKSVELCGWVGPATSGGFVCYTYYYANLADTRRAACSTSSNPRLRYSAVTGDMKSVRINNILGYLAHPSPIDVLSIPPGTKTNGIKVVPL